MVMRRIHLSSPHIGDEERELLLDAFDSNWIAPLGPHVDAFECEIAQHLDVAAAAATSSGTAALHLALIIAGVSPGDRVVCSSLTFAASANPIIYVGAEPVFIDCERVSWNLDPYLLEEELAESARNGKLPAAVICVDLYGQCADYARIVPICREFGVPLIEDAAESLGATCQGTRAGAFGAMAILSFNGNKIITSGGGGMLVSADPEKVARARNLASQARDPVPFYQHSAIGYNYRMSNLLAAVGRGQLRVLEDRVNARRRVFETYKKQLNEIAGITFIPESPWGRSNRWLTCIQVDPDEFGCSCDDVRIALEAENIESRAIWRPMHLQPVFMKHDVRGGRVAEEIYSRGLCLPSGSNLSGSDQERVIEIVKGCQLRSARGRLTAVSSLAPQRPVSSLDR